MTSIIEKIRKIQALANNAGTEHEAALAAERVAQLCREHNLDIGVATLVEEEKTATEAQREHIGQWQAHYTYLADACENVFHVGRYRKPAGVAVKDMAGRVIGSRDGQALIFFGLRANVAAAVETYEYLLASVEALLESHIRTGGRLNGASDFRSFRLGCANRIHKEATRIKDASRQLAAQSSECTALIRLENQLIQAHSKKLKLRSRSGSHSGAANKDAYSAGFAAGARVDFHGARTTRMIGGR